MGNIAFLNVLLDRRGMAVPAVLLLVAWHSIGVKLRVKPLTRKELKFLAYSGSHLKMTNIAVQI